jgi:hypothetical protein
MDEMNVIFCVQVALDQRLMLVVGRCKHFLPACLAHGLSCCLFAHLSSKCLDVSSWTAEARGRVAKYTEHHNFFYPLYLLQSVYRWRQLVITPQMKRNTLSYVVFVSFLSEIQHDFRVQFRDVSLPGHELGSRGTELTCQLQNNGRKEIRLRKEDFMCDLQLQ